MATSKRKDLLLTLMSSLIGAGIVTFLYWLITKIMTSIPIWAIFVLVFLVAFIGMKWRDWF